MTTPDPRQQAVETLRWFVNDSQGGPHARLEALEALATLSQAPERREVLASKVRGYLDGAQGRSELIRGLDTFDVASQAPEVAAQSTTFDVMLECWMCIPGASIADIAAMAYTAGKAEQNAPPAPQAPEQGSGREVVALQEVADWMATFPRVYSVDRAGTAALCRSRENLLKKIESLAAPVSAAQPFDATELDDKAEARGMYFCPKCESSDTTIELRCHSCVVSAAQEVPEGMLDRIKLAEQRIADNHAPRRIPAESSDVDLVLAEVRIWLEGKWPPFWLKTATARPETPDQSQARAEGRP